MATSSKHVQLTESELAGRYEVVEERADCALGLSPAQEQLSEVLRGTGGAVFQEDEFIAYLERIAATEDDLPEASPA